MERGPFFFCWQGCDGDFFWRSEWFFGLKVSNEQQKGNNKVTNAIFLQEGGKYTKILDQSVVRFSILYDLFL